MSEHTSPNATWYAADAASPESVPRPSSWWRKKRFAVPVGILALLVFAGACGEDGSKEVSLTAGQAQEANADAEAAEAAARQAAEDRAAAEAAASKAAADRAAAEAAAAEAAAEKVAAEKAAAERAASEAAEAATRQAAAQQAAAAKAEADRVAAEQAAAEQTRRTKPQAFAAAPAPPQAAGTDPRFRTCKDAKANGYGNYRRGVDPEYDWYRDADSDGIVCE